MERCKAEGMLPPFVRPHDPEKLFALPDLKSLGFTLPDGQLRAALQKAIDRQSPEPPAKPPLAADGVRREDGPPRLKRQR